MEESTEAVSLKECAICGRTFNPESLARHEKICEKTKTRPRRVFDSFRQRAKDINATPPRLQKQEENKKPKGTSKAQHQELLRAVKNEKVDLTSKVSDNGRPQQRVIPLGYSQCPVCRRCFNQKAADRHISWCREQLSRLPKSPPSSEALMRLRARIQYRAPLPARKRYSLADGQRLIKSADTCKSATLPRTYSSPCASNGRSGGKHVGFLLPSGPTVRRRSCERTTFDHENERDEIVYRNYSTMPLKSAFRKPSLQPVSVKFKEQFPQYNTKSQTNSQRQYERYRKEETETLYYGDNFPNISESDNILSALRLQLAEMQLVKQYQRGSPKNTDENLNLPVVLSNGSSCDTLVVETENRRISSGRIEASLPTVTQRVPSARMPRFCYQCGTKYPVASAKYCCECGAKRLVLTDGSSPVP